jgi:hypothetical protein
MYTVTSTQSVTIFNYQVGQAATFSIDPFIVSAAICGSDPVSVTYQGFLSTGVIIDPSLHNISISSTSGAISI